MSDDNGTVTAVHDGHIPLMTVDRVEKMNGFTPEMFDELANVMGELGARP